jgi:hypothetical protein
VNITTGLLGCDTAQSSKWVPYYRVTYIPHLEGKRVLSVLKTERVYSVL